MDPCVTGQMQITMLVRSISVDRFDLTVEVAVARMLQSKSQLWLAANHQYHCTYVDYLVSKGYYCMSN